MKRLIILFIGLFAGFIISYGQSADCNLGVDLNGDGLVDCSSNAECQFAPTIEKGCNCADGIDNDGDGKIDINDPDCAGFYGLTFVGDDTDCSIMPPVNTDFFDILDNPAVSGQNTVDTQSKMAIGDVDGDGIPDVVATSKWNQQIRVIATTDDQADGSDAGDIKASYKTTDPSPGDVFKVGGSTFFFDLEVLIADIDKDGTAELFATVYQRKNSNKQIQKYFLARFDYDSGIGDLVMVYGIDLGSERPGIPGIADFDGDGKAEIYLKNRIYAAESGVLLADAGGDWNTEVNAAPVAVNIIPGSPNLELVSGSIIYNVPNMASRTPVTLTVANDMNALGLDQYFPKVLNDVFEYGITNFSSTSVADFDDDGNLDVFLSGAIGSNFGHTAVFYWNVSKGTVGSFLPTHPDTGSGASKVTYPNGWPWGTGRVNLGELDGDGILEANFIAGNQLYALEEGAPGTLVQLWAGPKTLNDFRSGVVATTVYDFNNDGNPELIYRDTQVLSIIDGATGLTTHWSTSCQSHTMTEGPIIADVNGDGATDICVPCFAGPGTFKIDGPLSSQALGEIRLFFSNENAWLPSRKVWNQPGYFVVNINDDLTVPFPQLNQAMVFGNDPCDNGLPGPQTPFNTYLNQVPGISASGCPIYPAPDIAFIGDDPTLQPGDPGYVDPSDPNYFPAVEVIPPVCGDLEIEVRFNIINDGSRIISDVIPVTFWDGDPTIDPVPAPPATLLHTADLSLLNFDIGDTLIFSGITFNSSGKAFTLYIVLNDDGTSLPVLLDDASQIECKIANNIYAFPITPQPFVVQVNTKDNNKCDDSFPDDGWLDALVFENGVETTNYAKYGFQWYFGRDTLNSIPSPEGTKKLLDKLPGLAGVPEGAYTIVVTNLEKGCTSLPLDTAIIRTIIPPVVSITVLSDQTICSPENGELEGAVVGGNAGFLFRWYDVSAGLTFIADGITKIGGLGKGEYQLSVDRGDGCGEAFSDPITIQGPEFPDITTFELADVVDCADPESGKVSANAIFNAIVQDSLLYTFEWRYSDATFKIDGSLLDPRHTEPGDLNNAYPTRKKLPPGIYAVRAIDNATQCASGYSFAQVENITKIPELTLSEVAPQTSCDPASPNGKLRVDIAIDGVPQDPSLFIIEWFKGDNTLPANKIATVSGINGEIAEGIGAGGIPYTAKVTSSLNCAKTDTLSISEILILPVISAVPFNNTICDPALATATDFDGRIETSVTYNGNPVTDFTNFTFTWYEGTDIINDPPIPGETGPVLNNIDGGTYTVTVTLDSLFCTSNPTPPINVLDIFDLPVILIADSPETTCGGAVTPNGLLSASVDVGGIPVVAGYTYEWYEGIDINDPLKRIATVSGTENETAIDLNGGLTYTVRVINDATGCESQRSFFLDDNSINPVITLSKTDNTICDIGIGFTGSVTAVVTDINGSNDYANDYTFTWYQGPTATPGNEVADPDPLTPLTLEGREGNFYTLVVTNDVLGCSSLAQTIEVKDIPPPIIIVITENVASTNCAGGMPNGILAAAVDNGGGPVTAGYTFEWYVGLDTDPVTGTRTNTDGNDFRAIDLQGGAGQIYSVRVIENGSGCEEVVTEALNNACERPVVTLTTTENIGC
ncbi:MAG: hypothetical protein IIB82_03755, partial [Bacteroidetes bacterium]|nr:hypothetical protein [Bacteroidota bacterium]